ncbi:dynein regulatory complex subunit 5 [Euwallacea similis]|uniref:dynein regulatory complex subunit 5 n=1 Tax=Euwallacea similis TaxID=1736056 RepID=UPI00344D789B
MRIPSTINENCLKTYTPHKKLLELDKINSFKFDEWDDKIPKSLREQCVECIARNWSELQVLDEIVLNEDKHLLLDVLPVELKLELTIPKINDEVYWKKCCVHRWPKKVPDIKTQTEAIEIVREGIRENKGFFSNVSDRHTTNKSASSSSNSSSRKTSGKSSLKGNAQEQQQVKTWKKFYCEMHVKDYLENLKPEEYNPEKIKELCDLCGPYVQILRIQQMISSENSPNKIPLNSVITGLPHLTELHLRFKQVYAKEEFSWNMVNTSLHDIHLLAKGLEKTRLTKLSITNSDIDCEKLIHILKPLLKHDVITLDFSRCKIGDKALIALSKFVLERPVRELYIANNRIGPKGVISLAYATNQEGCNLKKLDLSLNRVSNNAGIILMKAMKTVKSLLLRSCGFSENFKMAGHLNSCLEELDLSNNALGEIMGRKILQALKSNSKIRKIDLRMCQIPSEIETEIQNELVLNRKGVKNVAASTDLDEIVWDDDVVMEFNHVLTSEHEDELKITSRLIPCHEESDTIASVHRAGETSD